MSTLFVAAVIVGMVAAVCRVMVSLAKRQKRKVMTGLLQRFSQLGSDHNLRFSGQEVLANTVIGLDGAHRKLAVLIKRTETDFDARVIHLDEIKTCSVKKYYGTIGVDDSRTKKPEQYLEKVVLHVAFRNGREPVEVMFYNHIDDAIYQIPELENKAKQWEVVLSKMQTGLEKRA